MCFPIWKLKKGMKHKTIKSQIERYKNESTNQTNYYSFPQ